MTCNTASAVCPVELGIKYILPQTLISSGSGTDLPLGIALALASQSTWPRYIYPLCVVRSHIFVLLASGLLPLLNGMEFVFLCVR